MKSKGDGKLTGSFDPQKTSSDSPNFSDFLRFTQKPPNFKQEKGRLKLNEIET